ncbi:hypothetical protein AVEN_115306-1 [Araneus ventricosus]|uniref:Uncharacterized protein n=1 Tax=Araneus ventricosus TaxID=182803 RepID=A0A4Y1ZY11_ARAVE|nr:hypothetical protein AVEN_115306-1 [Araneus ventricosus]
MPKKEKEGFGMKRRNLFESEGYQTPIWRRLVVPSDRQILPEKSRNIHCVIYLYFGQGRGGLVVRPRPWGRRAPGSKPDSTEDPPFMVPAAR